MSETEIEVTYLAKFLPQGLKNCPHDNITDIYLKTASKNSILRLRQKNDQFQFTKKEKQFEQDASVHIEQTINLNETEFQFLSQLPSLKLHKLRYYYPYAGTTLEIDIFQDELEGFVVVECEFPTERERDTFLMPDFCLTDVTQEKYIAGVEIVGKKYADIEPELEKVGYQRLYLN